MPEYLAPGVYVEEIDTGSKPIEGVSTSTAAMVGVTERGPVGVPVLVTSYGEYDRIFGGRLSADDFGARRHLPFAVEGFFTNGGKRLFVVRVLDDTAATRAAFTLHARAEAGQVETALLLASAENAGGTGNELFVLDGGSLVASPTQPVRFGDGSAAEYRFVTAVLPDTDSTHAPLHLPLNRTHASGTPVHHINRVAVDAFTLNADVAAGESRIVVDGAAADIAALAAGQQVEVGAGDVAEYRLVSDVTPDAVLNTRATLDLDGDLAVAHATGDAVTRLDTNPATVGVGVFGTTLGADARAGDGVAFVATRDDAGTLRFEDTADLVVFEPGTGEEEVRRIGDLQQLTLSRAVGQALPAGTLVEGVTVADDALDLTVRTLTRDATAGSRVIALDNRSGLAVGDVLSVVSGGVAEYAVVALFTPDQAAFGADPGSVHLEQPLQAAHATGDGVRLQTVAATAGRPLTATLFDAADGAVGVVVTDGSGYAANDVVRLGTPDGGRLYAALAAAPADLDPRLVEVGVPLALAHSAGDPVAERDALLGVEALDAGAWGNRVRVSVEDEAVGLVASTDLVTVVSGNQVRLGTYGGVEPGTVLELLDPAGAPVDELVKVIHVNRVNGTITLAAPLTAAHLAAIALALPARLRVRSREFRVTVRLYRAPDPAVPTRNETVLDTEIFRYLSMDPRHSNYVETILGAVDGPLRRWDRRPEGSSRYVRVDDRGTALEQVAVRLGPETLLDVLPSGSTRAARHPLAGGDDSLGTLVDDSYVGVNALDPDDRTGLHALRNVEEVSIVAAPGQVSVRVQGALIEHCELMRYRFAVLDGPPPPADSLTDVQAQRQQFDTRYAALYHPWPLIREPFPLRLDDAPLLAIPPAGHVIGVYARTDIERGVHKAPANEVVRGVESLSRLLNKEEQDILNPSPKNINVIRDFRPQGRGIRIWGARVITSDPDYKYVPVRRLLIFLEHSIDRGLQWVVFEPNAEPLWARVRQSVTSFLNVVWRNGALEGTKAEQAFFVKCDRTTMTQTDIDNGRLICVIGVAPVKPAEFVIIRIGLKTAEAES